MVDHAAMLLSTDWFAPHWSVIGIDAEAEKECFQKGCRDIVRLLINGAAEYYHVDFSNERINRTREGIRSLIRSCGLSEAAANRLEGIVAHKSGRDQLQKTAWLFRVLNDKLVQDEKLEKPIKIVLVHSRRLFSLAYDLDFEGMSLQSSTEWDKYIRSLTPELPTSLSDLVSTALLSTAELVHVLKRLTTTQRQHLHSRFLALAKSETGVEMERSWSVAEFDIS